MTVLDASELLERVALAKLTSIFCKLQKRASGLSQASEFCLTLEMESCSCQMYLVSQWQSVMGCLSREGQEAQKAVSLSYAFS